MSDRNDTGASICLIIFVATVTFCAWAWVMNDDFQQAPPRFVPYHSQSQDHSPYPYPECVDAEVVRNGSSYELELTDCVDN